ncbi:MAG TPA: hypothetical protein VLX61_12050 [Anaerolineales bacterium]|nr:hypothetical protein [Anaerolineales bacterium]
MRDWTLRPGDPLSLTLAADFRLSKPDYVNDHIWELEIGAGEPVALAIRTTYGLRARLMRIFYRFSELGKTMSNPAEFHASPYLRRFYPNFLWLECSPFEGLEVSAEYWVPESHALAGRLTLKNRTAFARKITIDLCGTLTPLEGQALKDTQQQMVNVLAGQTGGLCPVLFMTGGPQFGPAPHPSLTLALDFDPDSSRQLTWAIASTDSAEASFDLARRTAGRSWEAELAHIELVDAGDTFDIRTGDADWDAALAFSQRLALGLFFTPDRQLPNPSFVQSRQPDHGFSNKGDGQDYPPGWSGQSPLESYYLANVIAAAPHLTRGLIDNFLSTQTKDGSIDYKPGIAGQRGKLSAAPMLASMAWKYFQQTEDKTFLGEAFPKLSAFFRDWLSPQHDSDRDGLPSWDHIVQTGFEDNPLFDVWHSWSQGADISVVHDPALEAMLYKEARTLLQIAKRLNQNDEIAALEAEAGKLKSSVEASWDEQAALYSYRDRATKFCQTGKLLAKHKGPGNMIPKLEFEQPVRLLIEVQTKNPAAHRPTVEISDLVTKGRGNIELIQGDQFHRRSDGFTATSQKLFRKIGRIRIDGLEQQDRILVSNVNTASEDITLLTPLWAHIPDRQHAQAMVESSLQRAEYFGRPFGAPALSFVPEPEADAVAMSIHLPWNLLIGEGLLAYEFRSEAARLMGRLMNAVIQSLKQNHAFYQRYHAETGSGLGERGALNGLAPVGLFLQALGVTILSEERVRLEGKNPFAWPVTISYKGLKIVRGLGQTEIAFRNGKAITITDTNPLVVSMT